MVVKVLIIPKQPRHQNSMIQLLNTKCIALVDKIDGNLLRLHNGDVVEVSSEGIKWVWIKIQFID